MHQKTFVLTWAQLTEIFFTGTINHFLVERGIPPGAKLVATDTELNRVAETIELTFEHESFPAAPSGRAAPYADPIVIKNLTEKSWTKNQPTPKKRKTSAASRISKPRSQKRGTSRAK